MDDYGYGKRQPHNFWVALALNLAIAALFVIALLVAH